MMSPMSLMDFDSAFYSHSTPRSLKGGLELENMHQLDCLFGLTR